MISAEDFHDVTSCVVQKISEEEEEEEDPEEQNVMKTDGCG